jgi:hypothetical protein
LGHIKLVKRLRSRRADHVRLAPGSPRAFTGRVKESLHGWLPHPKGDYGIDAKIQHRKISAAARRRMAAGQRKRWAATKGQPTTPAETAPHPKGKLSAAGRAAIVAAMKKRWAEKKAAAKR